MPHELSNDELKLKCYDALARHEEARVLNNDNDWPASLQTILARALLSRLDAEKAQEKYTITVDYNCAGDHWEAARLYPERLRYGVAANGKTAREALAACIAKIKTLTPKEQP